MNRYLPGLEGETIVVTGASSGLGRAVAGEAASHGARVVLIARDHARLCQVKESLPGEGHVAFSFDLQNLTGIAPLLTEVVAKTGKPRGLVHCAGVCFQQPLRFLEVEQLQQTMRVNVESAFVLARTMRHRSVRGDQTSIVLVSSVAALLGAGSLTAYCASKGALVAGVRAMAAELAVEGIRINCVAPGYFESDMLAKQMTPHGQSALESLRVKHPLGLGTAEDVSHTCLFLLSHLSRWITGSTLVVDGGYSACK